MGGNALKAIEPRRVQRAEYDQLLGEVVERIKEETGFYSEGIRFYRSKPDFGDIDVLVKETGTREWWKYIFPESKLLVGNGNCTSLEYKGVQVDLISVEPHIFQTASDYFAWNDMGNLIGRIAHKRGLKYGFEGLHYRFDPGHNQVQNIVITRDSKRILEFLGFDYSRHKEGFDTLEEMFQTVVESPYFNPEIYAFENMNAVARIRDKKRSSYNAFLEYCTKLEKPKKGWFWYPPKGDFTRSDTQLIRAFPSFNRKLEDAWNAYNDWVLFKDSFNGNEVSKLTGLTDQRLGQLMKYMKEDFLPGEFQDYIIDSPPGGISQFILEKFAQFQIQHPS